MPFDKERYLADYITPRKSAKELHDDDLVERYALTLPASDAEIAERIRAVRSFWNVQRPGTRPGKVSRLCITDDERLRKQHGEKMLTAAWWTERAAEGRKANQARVQEMAGLLKAAYGLLDVVTLALVEEFASKLSLSRSDGLQAAESAGLTVVDGVELPTAPPITPTSFVSLSEHLVASGARTIPQLVHPGLDEFRLLPRFASPADTSLRLDGVAVSEQIAQVNRRGTSAEDTARRAALNHLNSALGSGVNLDELALYHLVSIAAERSSLGLAPVRAELLKYGLQGQDAAVVALLIVGARTTGPAGADKVQTLLAEGRLNEAIQLARQLPDNLERKAEAVALVEGARARLLDLLAEADRCRLAADEVRAMSLVREAAAISQEEADLAMATIPLPPPSGLRLVPEGENVRAVWQPGSGHGDEATYLLARSEQRAPVSPSDGQELKRLAANRFDDVRPPVARTLHYSVFAQVPGRPPSRAESASIVLLPAVTALAADVGPDFVTLHWSAHPSSDRVDVVRADPGHPPVPVPVAGSSCGLSGLEEGRGLHFQVTAIYRGLDGREMRSAPAQINATPLSESRPLPRLRARPVQGGGQVRVRVSWNPVDSSDIRIAFSGTKPPWTPGTWVTPEEVARFGTEVTGSRRTARGEVMLDADLPVGVHHLVALSTGGTGTVVGASATVAVTAPVTGLRATEFSDHAVLAWEWPATSQLAEVSWEVAGDADVVVLGQAEYRTAGGVRVPLGRSPVTAEVRALIHVEGVRYASPPATIDLKAVAEAAIRYDVRAVTLRALSRRSKRVTFVSDEACRGVRVLVIASPGSVMPLSADRGLPLLDTRLDLVPGVPTAHELNVPRTVPRPFWIRAFVAEGPARLIDPPTTQLKEG